MVEKKEFISIERRVKLLYKFLKRERILQSFISNVIEYQLNRRGNCELLPLSKKQIFRFIEQYTYGSISQAFRWAKTIEGKQYWRQISHEFESYISDEKLALIAQKKL